MTFREAFIQSRIELGHDREMIELAGKMADAMAPDAAVALAARQIPPGMEREIIDTMKSPEFTEWARSAGPTNNN